MKRDGISEIIKEIKLRNSVGDQTKMQLEIINSIKYAAKTVEKSKHKYNWFLKPRYTEYSQRRKMRTQILVRARTLTLETK